MADELNGIEDLEDRIYLEMVSWALRSSIDGRRRALRDGLREADAAGYARAERDVVVWLRRPYMSEVVGFEVGDGGRIEVAGEVEQGAHRGAAKEGT